MRATRIFPIFAAPAAACLLIVAPGLHAQTCALRNDMRLVNRVNEGTATDACFDSGWQTGRPLISPVSASDSSPLGSTSASWVATSDYGRLTFTGSGTGTSAPGNGLFMWCDECFGGFPKATFKDRLTIASATLPPGTPVSVRAWASFSGGASSTDPFCSIAYSAKLLASSNPIIAFAAPGQAEHVLSMVVGQSLDVQGSLFCTLRPEGMQQAGPRSATVEASLAADFSFSILTPGASLTWCSQAAYTCPADLGGQGGAVGGDGRLDNNDFVVFIDLFFGHDPRADIGATGGVGQPDQQWDNNDFVVFIDRFFSGC